MQHSVHSQHCASGSNQLDVLRPRTAAPMSLGCYQDFCERRIDPFTR